MKSWRIFLTNKATLNSSVYLKISKPPQSGDTFKQQPGGFQILKYEDFLLVFILYNLKN